MGKRARDAAEELVDEKRDGNRSMATTAHYVAVDRPDLQQLMRLASYINAVLELRWAFQNQEMPDEAYVEVDSRLGSVPAKTEVNR